MRTANGIEKLVADGICDDIVQRVKNGKEAEVFIVRKGEQYLAAKLYKERENRNFRNNAVYREGRQVRNSRDRRAMEKGTRYGVERAEEDWISTEHDALLQLQDSGARVPRPELLYENVLLMELVLDADGQPAPRLLDVPLTNEEAIAFHRDIIGQVIAMLVNDVIHGDLSPYNILVAWNGPTIIDLPQVIRAAHNQQAEELLVRDVRNVTEHLARFAPSLKRRIHDGRAIWRRYVQRKLTTDWFPAEGEWEKGGQNQQRRPGSTSERFGENRRTALPGSANAPRGPRGPHPERRPSDRPNDRPYERPGGNRSERPAERTGEYRRSADSSRPLPPRGQHPNERSDGQQSTRAPRIFDRSSRPAEGGRGDSQRRTNHRPRTGNSPPPERSAAPRRGNHRPRRGGDDGSRPPSRDR